MIKLSVISFDNKPVAQAPSAVFGETGGTVGRGVDNHLVVQDPKNFVSRTQAFVRSHRERHSITNLSQANPLLLNGVEIGYKQEHPIHPNDTLQIGMVCLAIEAVPSQSGASSGQRDAGMAGNAAVPHRSIGGASGAVLAAADSGMPLASPEPSDSASAVVTTAASCQPAKPETPGAAGDREALAQAFLRGAGIADNSVAIDLNADFMEMIGKMLALSIQGAVDQTKLRSLVKREVNADVTMVVVRGNNPIKFLEDGGTVLTQMLRKKMPGFMAPVEAMQDAYEDLYAHQLAVVAGMRAMVADILTRLDPESKGDEPAASIFKPLMQANRNAKQLESLTARYRDLCREYSGDNAPMFGMAFLDAYEREAEQFRSGADHAG